RQLDPIFSRSIRRTHPHGHVPPQAWPGCHRRVGASCIRLYERNAMQQPDQVTLTIDGKEVTVPKGTLVLHAAQKLGIDVPIFCYHNKMDPLGACRMCLVAIEKQTGLPPACATPVAPGMVVTTKSEAVE